MEVVRSRLMAIHNRNSIRVFINSRHAVTVHIPDDHVDPYGSIGSAQLTRFAYELSCYIRLRFETNYWQAQGFERFHERHHRQFKIFAFFLWSLRYGETRLDRDLFDPLPDLLAWFEYHLDNVD